MLDGFSDRARAVVATATNEARRQGHPTVGTEHLLLGLLADRDGGSGAVLRRAGASLEAARHKVAELGTATDETADAAESEDPAFTSRAQRALERAGRFARNDRAGKVGTDHVLLGVLDVEGLGCQVLRGLGVDVAKLREDVASARTSGSTPPAPEQPAEDAVAPRCPSCGAQLDASLAARVLHPQRETGTAMRVLVLYCAECGTALGYLPP